MSEEKTKFVDFHAGNIMVDKKTALPYVIDFGKTTELETAPSYKKQDDEYVEKTKGAIEDYMAKYRLKDL
ncbi:hypothetical protein ISS03_04130 [Patescibacteria group bacterium]|nr:hypothetical protein [Patescibacteria group bacterium]